MHVWNSTCRDLSPASHCSVSCWSDDLLVVPSVPGYTTGTMRHRAAGWQTGATASALAAASSSTASLSSRSASEWRLAVSCCSSSASWVTVSFGSWALQMLRGQVGKVHHVPQLQLDRAVIMFSFLAMLVKVRGDAGESKVAHFHLIELALWRDTTCLASPSSSCTQSRPLW